jgi:hypothetical protein
MTAVGCRGTLFGRIAQLRVVTGVARLFGARDEFHLAAIVQNLKTLANRIWRPLPNKLAASQSRPCSSGRPKR